MINYGLSVRLGSLDDLRYDQMRIWRNNYHVWRYCRQNDLISRMDHLRWENSLAGDSTRKMYSVISYEGEGVGVAGFSSMDLVNRRAEFSLYIAPEQRGKGHGRDALMTLVSHGFNSFGLHSIWGESFDFNPALDIFKKLGFRRDGVRRDFYYREGRFIDAHLISLLRGEWEDNEIFDECRRPCFT